MYIAAFLKAVQRIVLTAAYRMIAGNNLVRNPDALTQGIAVLQDPLDRGYVTEDRI